LLIFYKLRREWTNKDKVLPAFYKPRRRRGAWKISMILHLYRRVIYPPRDPKCKAEITNINSKK
jgi:hypothetical protein